MFITYNLMFILSNVYYIHRHHKDIIIRDVLDGSPLDNSKEKVSFSKLDSNR